MQHYYREYKPEFNAWGVFIKDNDGRTLYIDGPFFERYKAEAVRDKLNKERKRYAAHGIDKIQPPKKQDTTIRFLGLPIN